jgi:hypothetical protein
MHATTKAPIATINKPVRCCERRSLSHTAVLAQRQRCGPPRQHRLGHSLSALRRAAAWAATSRDILTAYPCPISGDNLPRRTHAAGLARPRNMTQLHRAVAHAPQEFLAPMRVLNHEQSGTRTIHDPDDRRCGLAERPFRVHSMLTYETPPRLS